MYELDHLVWAAPNLEEAVQQFEGLTGIRATLGGNHPQFGTRNALASLGDGCYFEILAPDETLADGDWSRHCRALAQPRLLMWALKTVSAETTTQHLLSLNLPARRFPMSRTTPDGRLLRWQLVWLDGLSDSGRYPFFIDWLDTPHPSNSTPSRLTLQKFYLITPNVNKIAAFFTALSIKIDVKYGTGDSLVAQLDTPKGKIIL